MNDIAPSLGHYTVERYYALCECGILTPDDRVELLDALIVAMPPRSDGHDDTIHVVLYALQKKLSLEVAVRLQSPFMAGGASVPQPDVAIVPGKAGDYFDNAPAKAHLIVEVSQSSLAQDRLTKSAIYARAGVPCYWIVNLRDLCVEVYREPDLFQSEYRSVTRATGSDILTIDDFPGAEFEAAEFLPRVAYRGSSPA
ncbi:MAG: Uma2 family endonuclease [Candidatus Binatia bacterium]